MLIYGYIDTSGNWENNDCVETRVFSHNFEFSQFPRFFYNIAQRTIKKEIFRVDIELYQHGS